MVLKYTKDFGAGWLINERWLFYWYHGHLHLRLGALWINVCPCIQEYHMWWMH